MKFVKDKSRYILKLERGEEVVESITSFAKQEGIDNALVSAIGAVDKITLGFYELKTKSYHWRDFTGDLEVTSLTGNITLLEGSPFLHAHLTIADENLNSFGGHLKEARVGVTLEVIIEKLDSNISRKMDREIGLNLLDL